MRLTGLECRKVFGAVFVAIARDRGVEIVRSALDKIAAGEDFWATVGDMHGHGGVVMEAAFAVHEDRLASVEPSSLKGSVPLVAGFVIGRLLTMASADDVRGAVRWWAKPGRIEAKLR